MGQLVEPQAAPLLFQLRDEDKDDKRGQRAGSKRTVHSADSIIGTTHDSAEARVLFHYLFPSAEADIS